jgi:outer membrane protein OmpA-like peptidoglycan-associated protein
MATRHYVDHGADEESYFVSMTDVFIGLLFIFIIMLMFFAMRFQEATQKQNEETQKQAVVTQEQKEATEKQNALIEDLTDSETTRVEVLQTIGTLLQKQGLDVFIIRDEGILRLPEKMLFAKSNWELGASGGDASKALKVLGDALDQILPCYTLGARSRQDNCPKTKAKIEAIFIEGHADADVYQRRPKSVAPTNSAPESGGVFSLFRRDSSANSPTGQTDKPHILAPPSAPPKDNLDLSALRATSTFRELLRVKPELSLYQNPNGKPILSVSGYGAFRPVTAEPGELPEIFKQRNRRIDLRILMATPKSDDAKQIPHDLQTPPSRP